MSQIYFCLCLLEIESDISDSAGLRLARLLKAIQNIVDAGEVIF